CRILGMVETPTLTFFNHVPLTDRKTFPPFHHSRLEQSCVNLRGTHPVVSLSIPQAKAKTFTGIPSPGSLQDGSVSAIANEIIETLGYFNPGDGGRACYEIVNSLDGEFGESITVNLYAKLLSTEYVNYKMFGAQGDGVSDDGEAILKAHSYAN